jgi:IclR family KDG regulon transcriptional repressor
MDDLAEKQTSAVTRTITVLEILSKYKLINLEQLAKETDLPKATLLRFLTTLASLGYVHRDQYDQYSLTLKMFSVGSRCLEHTDLIGIAHPIAEQLSERLGETVHMGILEDLTAIYVLKIESKYTIRMHSRVGKAIPLYSTAIGKIFLSDMEAAQRKETISRIKLVPFTPNTIKSATELEKELITVRKNGVAHDRCEQEDHLSCIATAIRDYSGKTVAALSVTWPLFRYEKEREREYEQSVQDAAREISGLLGYC